MLTEAQDEVGERGHEMVEVVASQEWLGTVGDFVQKVVGNTFEAMGPVGGPLRNVLHGVWLGHPLHPALTDVPIGAWTVTVVLDGVETVSGRTDLAPGADAALGVGLLGAVGAAVTGLTDYQHAEGRSRRLGAAHALLNVAATACMAGSWLLRKADARGAAKAVALVGFAMANASAHLGGDLVFDEQLGVDHAAATLDLGYRPALPAVELKEGEPRQVVVDGVKVLLVRDQGRMHALADACGHMGGLLSEGQLEDGCITCPWHGSTFRLEDGTVLRGPSTYSQPSYETRVVDGIIEVRLIQHGTPSAADAARCS